MGSPERHPWASTALSLLARVTKQTNKPEMHPAQIVYGCFAGAGRAMELGRECLKLWGYSRVDELIWVKTNQLQVCNPLPS